MGKPIEIKVPEPKAVPEEEEDEDEEAKEDAPAEGEEGAEPEEPAEPPGPVYFPMPGYGFVVVQNAAGGSEERVEPGYTKIGAVTEFVETGEVSITFDPDTTAGGAIFVVPCLDQAARQGSYTLMTIGDQDDTRLEPTPGTRQEWLKPPTPLPTPREVESDVLAGDAEAAEGESEEAADEGEPTEE